MSKLRSQNFDGELKFEWSSSFATEHNNKLNLAQMRLDSDCIRFMQPYMPFRTGKLSESAALGTVIGSGEIRQNIVYAHYQYYGKHPSGTQLQYDKTAHPLAGKMWFERMIADHKNDLLQGVAEIMGGIAK